MAEDRFLLAFTTVLGAILVFELFTVAQAVSDWFTLPRGANVIGLPSAGASISTRAKSASSENSGSPANEKQQDLTREDRGSGHRSSEYTFSVASSVGKAVASPNVLLEKQTLVAAKLLQESESPQTSSLHVKNLGATTEQDEIAPEQAAFDRASGVRGFERPRATSSDHQTAGSASNSINEPGVILDETSPLSQVSTSRSQVAPFLVTTEQFKAGPHTAARSGSTKQGTVSSKASGAKPIASGGAAEKFAAHDNKMAFAPKQNALAPAQSLDSDYTGKIWSALARRKPRANQRGSATVTFAVTPRGELHSVRISSSSGNAKIDQLALTTVKRAAPFPPSPSRTTSTASYMIRIDFD